MSELQLLFPHVILSGGAAKDLAAGALRNALAGFDGRDPSALRASG
jgi:hypothetical protein